MARVDNVEVPMNRTLGGETSLRNNVASRQTYFFPRFYALDVLI